jgi:hypothetical protein
LINPTEYGGRRVRLTSIPKHFSTFASVLIDKPKQSLTICSRSLVFFDAWNKPRPLVGQVVGLRVRRRIDLAGKLNARRVESLKEPGRHSDGGNLFLFISPNGAKRWTFLYRWKGGRREMGLGSASPGQVSLAEARNKALDARRLLNDGIDPLAARKALERAAIIFPTFGAFVEEYLKAHRPKFKNSKHADQWEATLGANYCGSLLNKPVNEIDTEAILKVLQPIWVKVPETASRLRGRLENVLDAAKVRGFFTNENPARWKGHLKAILPARQKLSRGHHAAMAYGELPEFMSALRTKQALAALALELTILCASRTSESINATWAEIDFEKAVWTIPKERMKARKEIISFTCLITGGVNPSAIPCAIALIRWLMNPRSIKQSL